MNRLPRGKQSASHCALVEANSIRTAVRMTGVAKNTIVNLLTRVGEDYRRYQDSCKLAPQTTFAPPRRLLLL